MTNPLNPQQFTSVGRKQISTDDIVSRGDKGPLRVRSTEHSENGFTYVNGVHVDTGEPASIMLYQRQRARRHAE